MIAAKTEAALKGFEFEISSDASSQENFSLSAAEQKAALDAVNKSILKAAGQKIPKTEYTKYILEESTNILINNGHENKLSEFTGFITQGKKSSKFSFSPDEEKTLSASAKKACQDIIKFTNEVDKSTIKSLVNKIIKEKIITHISFDKTPAKAKLQIAKLDQLLNDKSKSWEYNDQNARDSNKLQLLNSQGKINYKMAKFMLKTGLAK